jgi:hypothetical protein
MLRSLPVMTVKLFNRFENTTPENVPRKNGNVCLTPKVEILKRWLPLEIRRTNHPLTNGLRSTDGDLESYLIKLAWPGARGVDEKG